MFSQNDIIMVAVAIVCLFERINAVKDRRPNIIVILADDLGWNDVSFHGSNQFHTPNIDALAYNGVILNLHYVPALCTPSRASFLTGKYPTSLGMQHLVILASEPWGLPLEETLMPQHLKRHGYATHAIGKWHLGYHKKEYTPLYRGFDSHFGYWNGFQDYYDHTMHAGTWKGYDMRRGMDVDYSSKGLYSTDAFTNEAVSIIKNHNSTQGPLFMYLSHLAPHSGNPSNPFQAPEEEILKHSHVKDPERRTYAAMVTKLDESVGKIMMALRNANMLDNSIVLFMADNGGVTYGIHSNRASNYPLRGLKESPWEGGVRGVAAIWSPLLHKPRRVSNQVMHMSDWLPTFYAAAGLNSSELNGIDGMNMWNVISYGEESQRKEIFHNHDEIEGYSALQVGTWKFVEGSCQNGAYDEWYGESGREETLNYDPTLILKSKANKVIRSHLTKGNDLSEITVQTILNLRQDALVTCEYPKFSAYSLITQNHTRQPETDDEVNDITYSADVKSELINELENIYRKHPPLGVVFEKFSFSPKEKARLEEIIDSGKLKKIFQCDPMKMVCLFNLKSDPCERVNLATVFPDIVENLKIRLSELKTRVVKPLNLGGDPFSNPAFHNNTWANWQDVDGNVLSQSVAMMKHFVRFATSFDYRFIVLLTKTHLSELPISNIDLSTSIVKVMTWLLALGTIIVVKGAAKRLTNFALAKRKIRHQN